MTVILEKNTPFQITGRRGSLKNQKLIIELSFPQFLRQIFRTDNFLQGFPPWTPIGGNNAWETMRHET